MTNVETVKAALYNFREISLTERNAALTALEELRKDTERLDALAETSASPEAPNRVLEEIPPLPTDSDYVCAGCKGPRRVVKRLGGAGAQYGKCDRCGSYAIERTLAAFFPRPCPSPGMMQSATAAACPACQVTGTPNSDMSMEPDDCGACGGTGREKLRAETAEGNDAPALWQNAHDFMARQAAEAIVERDQLRAERDALRDKLNAQCSLVLTLEMKERNILAGTYQELQAIVKQRDLAQDISDQLRAKRDEAIRESGLLGFQVGQLTMQVADLDFGAGGVMSSLACVKRERDEAIRERDAALRLVSDAGRWDTEREMLRVERDEAIRTRVELEAALTQVDDVLLVNWVGPRKDGDYHQALADLTAAAIQEHDDPCVSEVARKRQADLAAANERAEKAEKERDKALLYLNCPTIASLPCRTHSDEAWIRKCEQLQADLAEALAEIEARKRGLTEVVKEMHLAHATRDEAIRTRELAQAASTRDLESKRAAEERCAVWSAAMEEQTRVHLIEKNALTADCRRAEAERDKALFHLNCPTIASLPGVTHSDEAWIRKCDGLRADLTEAVGALKPFARAWDSRPLLNMTKPFIVTVEGDQAEFFINAAAVLAKHAKPEGK